MATQPVDTQLRKTGIGLVGDVPWGTHFFMFYETKEDLLDTLVPYFKAGLGSGELCLDAIEGTISSTGARCEIVIRSAKNREGVLVQVQDSGPGIAPELADRIFEPFFSTKAKGIGMGLSISRSIIESHGGYVGIGTSSTGALFEFTLPID